MFDVKKVREDFPFFKRNIDGIYFDNGATSLKPKCVIDRINDYNSYESCSNHSTDYKLVYELNKEMEDVRKKIAKFINANENEIVFTSGSTHSSNLLALSYGMNNYNSNDSILTSYVEHASSILPWFNVSKKTGASIKYFDFDENFKFNLDNFKKAFNDSSIKVVVIAQTSNVLSYTLPIKDICKIAHEHNAIVICDCAQSAPHLKIDVKDSDVDFLFFSAHKMIGPTGIGVLYGKFDLLDKMDPLFYGGSSNARFDKDKNIILKETPHKFESGTLNISAILGFGKAIDYINSLGQDNIREYEEELSKYLIDKLSKLDNIIIYNKLTNNSVISFNVKDIFSQDVASYLGTKGIYVRSGNHCAKLLHNLIGTDDTVRASLYFYNTKEEIDKFVQVLSEVSIDKVIGTVL